MDTVVKHVKLELELDPAIAHFITHLYLSPDLALRTSVREDDNVKELIRLSDVVADGAPASVQLHTVCAAVHSVAGAALCAEVVQHWPGGRHGNDHAEFRDISIEPVAAEVVPGAPDPFLPMADGSDQFLAGQVRSRRHPKSCSETTLVAAGEHLRSMPA